MAAIQLAAIGTKESSDMLMQLIEKKVSSMYQDVLIVALIVNSPFREEYKERLLQIEQYKERVTNVYSEVEMYDPNLFGYPLWQEISEAVVTGVASQLNAITSSIRPAVCR